ncbi:MAG: hypothetical protein Q9195_005780 [Heterodermia aff. obscurata]
MSAVHPVTGHLSNIFGRRNALLVVNIVFIVGTLICGLSPKLWVLLLGRSIEGLGGGSMASVTAFIETDLVPLRNRGITEGLGGVIYGVAIGVGGLFGGGVNDHVGWKWAFLIQVPIIAASTILVCFLVKIPKKKSDISSLRRVDYVGGFSIIASIVLLQLGLDTGGTRSWASPVVLASLPLAGACFITFMVWDLKFAQEPVIPLRLLTQRNVWLSNAFYFFALMSYFTIEFYVPIYLQVLGHTPTATGLRFLPQAAGAAIATFAAGVGVKLTGKYYWLNAIAQVFSVLGSGLLLTLNTDTAGWCPFVFLAFTGIGFGASWVTVLMGVLSSIDDEQQATIQSAGYAVRSVGMTVGLTVATAVFQQLLKSALATRFASLPGTNVPVSALRSDFNALQGLDPVSRNAARGAYMEALHAVFWITTAESVIAGVASMLMKENFIPDSLKG